MFMRPIATPWHLRGCRAAVRTTALLAAVCAMLVFSAAPSQSQNELDIWNLFAEHLPTAHGITSWRSR